MKKIVCIFKPETRKGCQHHILSTNVLSPSDESHH